MTWFKVDDKLAFHPKVLAAGNPAMGLWVRAGAWASDQLTDGFIPAAMVKLLDSRRTPAVNELITSGLWIPDLRGGYVFHDWHQINPTRAQIMEARDTRSESAILANHNRWHRGRGVSDVNCPHCTRRATDQSTDQYTDQSTDQSTDQ